MPRIRSLLQWLLHQLLRRRRLVVVAVFLIGSLFSAGMFLNDWKRARTEVDRAFRSDASRQFLIIEEELEEAVNSVGSVADLFRTVVSVDRRQFREFVRPQIGRAPGLVALLWAPRVLEKDRARFEAAGRREWGPDFQIFDGDTKGGPAGRRAEYFPVHFRESVIGPTNTRVVGQDWSAGAVSLEALQRARDTGMPSLTAEMPLIGGARGVRVFWPIYRSGAPASTTEQRRLGLRGFVGASFEIERLIAPTFGAVDSHGIDIVLRDEESPEDRPAMYSHSSRMADPARSWPGQRLAEARIRAGLRWTRTLKVAGRRWEVSFTPTAAYVSARIGPEIWEDLPLGLLITAMVGGYLLLLMRRTDEVERLVASRTQELRQAHDRLLAEMSERTQAETVAKRLTLEVLSIQEEERRRLSRELHDEAGQSLTGLVINLQLLQAEVPETLASLQRRLQDAVDLARGAAERVRIMARGLRPPGLDTLGLNVSLRGLCHEVARRTGLSIAYTGAEVAPLPDPITICLYRILQEALTNAAKHARADRIVVTLQDDAEAVILSIADDGQGFDASAVLSAQDPFGGIGLTGMQERLELVGGSLEIVSRVGKGTRLVAQVPLADEPRVAG